MTKLDELAEQAGWGKGETRDDCMQCSPFDKEKFAELIVRECIAQVRKDENGPAYEAAGRIAEHFGIES